MQDCFIVKYKDAELVALMAQDNKKAFEVIYDRYADALYQFVYNRVRIREVSEELVQEIFVWIWIHRKRIVITTSLGAYLFTAVRHMLLNYRRSEQIKRKYTTDLALTVSEHNDNRSEQLLNVADIHSAIETSIASLPEKCRTAFRLSRLEHLSILDVAVRMKISRRTVENYISQALKHLRESRSDIFSP